MWPETWYALHMRRAFLAALVVAIAVPGSAQAHRVAVTAPARGDVTLAQIRYAVPPGARPALRLALAGAAPTDYVAVALPRHQPAHALVALVAVVNRDARTVGVPDTAVPIVLSTRPSRPLARPVTSVATNVLRAAPAPPPRACALGALGVGDLRLALHGGATPPRGFGARATIVQALDGACGRAVAPAFRVAVAPPQLGQPTCPPPCRPIERVVNIACPETPPPVLCPRPS
jgi:hypothetical protein